MTKQLSDYGCWPAAITSDLLTKGQCRLSEPQLDGSTCYWLESRPEEKGRGIIVAQELGGVPRDITPNTMNVRSRIHEYGGGCFKANNGVVYFCNDADQRVYKLDTRNQKNNTVIALTPEGDYRYADFCIDEQRQQLICICEIHGNGKKEPENCIVAIKLDGSSTTAFNILAFGNDFYSNPRVSPDGNLLSWLSWNHPNMPWDNSECWLAEFNQGGLLTKHHKVAGGLDDGSRNESIFQPQWSPTGELYFISDRNLWWNLYHYDIQNKRITPVIKHDAEFATPQWVFGMSTYGFLNSFTIFCCYTQKGQWHAALIDTLTLSFKPLNLPYNSLDAICCNDETDTAVFIAANSTSNECIGMWHKSQCSELKSSGALAIGVEHLSHPESIEFKNPHQQTVHGFYYPPSNQHYHGPSNSLPPLIVICHGGPTGSTKMSLNLKIQYWTNRGFAVFDINYSGSTGYGRAYRDRLKGQWGILDVDDICAGAEHLIAAGKVDPKKIIVRGSSAGGFSVLAALTFRNTFSAGASLYGISDLSLLAEDTHKFESRYMDKLIGAYPKEKATYQARSPLLHVEQLNCPVIFLQGLQDKVVPPNQAQVMVGALAKKHIPVAYAIYPEEGHGFRQGETIRHSLDVEYAFYTEIFNLSTSEALPAVPFITAKNS